MDAAYTSRVIACPDCFDGDYTIANGPGYVTCVCETCEGRAEIDAACEQCGKDAALNDELICERCHDANELPASAFWKKYGFVESITDFSVKELPNGRFQVAA